MNGSDYGVSTGDLIAQLHPYFASLRGEVAKVIVGQEQMIEGLLLGLLCGGHVLLEGVPGLAKTLTVRTLARALNLGFRRIQFTPDLLPADLLGTQIFDAQTREFQPKFGPIFSNIVLADEINRAPAKVQSALLEAMEEKQVTLGDKTYRLPQPFFVMATQNPLEQEGTYPLPEAQMDRFLLKIVLGYPRRTEERLILDRSEGPPPAVQPVLNDSIILQAQEVVKGIHLSPAMKDYILDIVQSSRPGEEPSPRLDAAGAERVEELRQFVDFGISPRGTIALGVCSKARAFLEGRSYVIPDDVRAVVPNVLRHRIILSYRAEAEGISAEDWLRELLSVVPVP